MINKTFLKKYEHLIFLVLDLGLNGFNYFFHIFVAWYLLPKDYGTLNSLLSFASILFVLWSIYAKAVAIWFSMNA